MITLLASTTAMAVLDFGLPARRRKAATLSETIWRLAREMSFEWARAIRPAMVESDPRPIST